MKKITAMLSVSIFTIVLSSCAFNTDNTIDVYNENTSSEINTTVSNTTTFSTTYTIQDNLSYEEREKLEYEAVLEKITDQPYKKVIKNTTSDEILKNFLEYHLGYYDSKRDYIVRVDSKYEIELIRKPNLDSKDMYTIHKVESGGLFLYVLSKWFNSSYSIYYKVSVY